MFNLINYISDKASFEIKLTRLAHEEKINLVKSE